jgi:hypothetical protein
MQRVAFSVLLVSFSLHAQASDRQVDNQEKKDISHITYRKTPYHNEEGETLYKEETEVVYKAPDSSLTKKPFQETWGSWR